MADAEFSFRYTRESQAEVLRTLGAFARHAPTVMFRSINRTLKSGRTTITKRVGKELNLKAAFIKKHFHTRKATKKKLSGSITIDYQSTQLIDYKAKTLARGRGVSAKVRRRGGTEKFRHRFIAKGSGGKKQVFERQGKARYALQRAAGPSVLGVVADTPGELEKEIKDMSKTLEKNTASQVDNILKRGRP